MREFLVDGGGIHHHLVWDDDYCFECNSRVDYGRESRWPLHCPECGESWTTNSGRATNNWQRVIDHLLCRMRVANFKVAQDRAQDVARAKAGGFSSGWIPDVAEATGSMSPWW